MNHFDIVKIGVKWLKNHKENVSVPNCSIIAKELTSAVISGEKPDIIGWCSWTSVLIEIKTSKSDFLKDFKKPFRCDAEKGMGELRYFLCPIDLIKIKELPKYWGLLYIDETQQIKIIHKAEHQISNLNCERTLLISLMRRKNK